MYIYADVWKPALTNPLPPPPPPYFILYLHDWECNKHILLSSWQLLKCSHNPCWFSLHRLTTQFPTSCSDWPDLRLQHIHPRNIPQLVTQFLASCSDWPDFRSQHIIHIPQEHTPVSNFAFLDGVLVFLAKLRVRTSTAYYKRTFRQLPGGLQMNRSHTVKWNWQQRITVVFTCLFLTVYYTSQFWQALKYFKISLQTLTWIH